MAPEAGSEPGEDLPREPLRHGDRTGNEPRGPVGEGGDARLGCAVALLAVLGAGAFFWHWQSDDLPEMAAEVDDLLGALRRTDDVAAYALMSEGYRQRRSLDEYRRAVGTVSELRSARGVILYGSAAERWGRPNNPTHLCGRLEGLGSSDDTLIALTFVPREGGWAIDALAVGRTHLDPDHPTQLSVCSPHRGH